MTSGTDILLPSLPVLIPLAAGIFCLLSYRRLGLQRFAGALALLANLAAAVALLWRVLPEEPDAAARVLVVQVGNWPAPFGISVVIDTLSAALLCVTAVVALATKLFIGTEASLRFTSGYFHPLFQMLVLGVNWAFIAGDLFNLFVSFEVMLMASYVLLVIGTTHRQMRHAFKYVILNVVASTIFVAACGWVYGKLGTLNLAELAHLASTGALPPGSTMAVGALAMVFAAKGAVFPLWFWLPDAYPALPTGLGALFAALLTKVGVYAIMRVVVMCFGANPVVAQALAPVLLVAAGVTMLLGALGIAGAASLRWMLSCGILVGVGYMLLGPALVLTQWATISAAGAEPASPAAQEAMTGAVFYMLQHMLVIAALLLCVDVVVRYTATDLLERVGGFAERSGALAALFFLAAIALVGLPPSSGFVGKLLLVRASLLNGGPWGWSLAALILIASALSLFGLGRAWCATFWSARPATESPAAIPGMWGRLLETAPPAVLIAISLAMGLFASPYIRLCEIGAGHVLDSQPYIRAVLGGSVTRQPPPLVPEATDISPREGAAR